MDFLKVVKMKVKPHKIVQQEKLNKKLVYSFIDKLIAMTKSKS